VLSIVVIALAISGVTGTVTYVRNRRFTARGCSRCAGRVEEFAGGLRCSPCRLFWTREGVPIGHTAADVEIPRAQVRRP